MSEEEIELLKEMQANCYLSNNKFYEDRKAIDKGKAIEKVLNLIEKQQTKIDQAVSIIKQAIAIELMTGKITLSVDELLGILESEADK